MDSVTIVTPFYNEYEGLDNYFKTLIKINNLIKNKIKVYYLFIDDGSSDLTPKKLKEFKKKHSSFNIKILTHKKNYGYGRTLKNSIKISKTKYLLTYDSDCTYDFKKIKQLIELIIRNNFDIINVSYRLAKNNFNVSLFRQFLSWSGSEVYKFFFKEIKKYNITVYTCSFRIYNLRRIKKIKLNSDDFNCCAELMIKAMLKEYKIFEIGGKILIRKYGLSKMKILKNIFNTLLTLAKLKLGY